MIFMAKADKTKIPDDMPNARFATRKEIREGNREAKAQIAARNLKETAFELNPETKITFANSNPGGRIIGLAGTGKTLNGILPLIRSAIRQEHTVFITDIEGELMLKTAAYALAYGYKLYVFAPGVTAKTPWGSHEQFTGSFNFLDVMRHKNDKTKAQEITQALNVNSQEDTQKRHAYFGPQSDALMETVLMLAKGSRFPDMLMVWSILTLPKLAERLAYAASEGRFDKDLPFFALQSSAGIRAVAGKGGAGGDSPATSIQSSAFNLFSKFIDPGILPCLMPSSIPLDHPGKSITYIQIDRTQLKATSPLGATGLHLWLNYNLDPARNRERNLTLISDEANFFILPSLEALAKLARKKGGTFWLAFQQNSSMALAYGKERWSGLAANLKNMLLFNTGESAFHKEASASFGQKTIITKTANRAKGKGGGGSSDQLKEVPLVPASELDLQMKAGHCVIKSASYKHPISFLDRRIPYNPKSKMAKQEKKCEAAWTEKILPALQAEYEQRMNRIIDPLTGESEPLTVDHLLKCRGFEAEDMLPLPEDDDEAKAAEALLNKKDEAPATVEDTPIAKNDKPVTLFTPQG